MRREQEKGRVELHPGRQALGCAVRGAGLLRSSNNHSQGLSVEVV
jgi:hypothetical protein